jgi:hypothetical protein
MKVWRDKHHPGPGVHNEEVIHECGRRDVHKWGHICIFIAVSGSGCPLMFPPEVRPPCGTSPAWSIEGDGLRSRSGFVCEPATKFVDVSTEGFHYSRSSAIYSKLSSISLFGVRW